MPEVEGSYAKDPQAEGRLSAWEVAPMVIHQRPQKGLGMLKTAPPNMGRPG